MSWVYHISNRAGSMTQAEMEQNVDEIYAQLFSVYGWSLNSICGLLGNMQHESYINPAQTQIGYPIGTESGGYGLVQWTPARKIKNWLRANNHALESGFWQIYAINFQPEGVEWIPTSQFPETYDEFKHSEESVAYLTECFLKNYERAGVAALEQRITYAENWYEYITGTHPDPPEPPDPDPHGYKSTFKQIIFLRSRNLRF